MSIQVRTKFCEWEYREASDSFWNYICKLRAQKNYWRIFDGVMVQFADCIRLLVYEQSMSATYPSFEFKRNVAQFSSEIPTTKTMLVQNHEEDVADTRCEDVVSRLQKAADGGVRVLYLGHWRTSEFWMANGWLPLIMDRFYHKLVSGEIRVLWIQSFTFDIKPWIQFLQHRHQLTHTHQLPFEPFKMGWIAILMASTKHRRDDVYNWIRHQVAMFQTRIVFISEESIPKKLNDMCEVKFVFV